MEVGSPSDKDQQSAFIGEITTGDTAHLTNISFHDVTDIKNDERLDKQVSCSYHSSNPEKHCDQLQVKTVQTKGEVTIIDLSGEEIDCIKDSSNNAKTMKPESSDDSGYARGTITKRKADLPRKIRKPGRPAKKMPHETLATDFQHQEHVKRKPGRPRKYSNASERTAPDDVELESNVLDSSKTQTLKDSTANNSTEFWSSPFLSLPRKMNKRGRPRKLEKPSRSSIPETSADSYNQIEHVTESRKFSSTSTSHINGNLDASDSPEMLLMGSPPHSSTSDSLSFGFASKPASKSSNFVPKKRGRPRKYFASEKGVIPVKKVGRPRLTVSDCARTDPGNYQASFPHLKSEVSAQVVTSPGRRKRGRPRKYVTDQHMLEELTSSASSSQINGSVYKSATGRSSTFAYVIKLCAFMHKSGWAPGTSGGILMKDGCKLYIVPVGTAKDELDREDVIVKSTDSGANITQPISSDWHNRRSESLLSPLITISVLRETGAVFHSQAESAVLASLVFKGKEFRVTHQEILKMFRKGSTRATYRFDETLVIPIIENAPTEELCKNLQTAIELYPDSNAVIVRRHGAFVWGETWQSAKAQAECYHYLFSLVVRLKQIDVEPFQYPRNEYGITSF